MNRAARNIRSGSSSKLISGASGVRSTPLTRSIAPSNGSTRTGSAPPATGVSSSAMALIVKSRRLRSVSIESENVTVGLRESSRYASERNVVISKTRSAPSADRRLAPDRPERLALVPHRVRPTRRGGL